MNGGAPGLESNLNWGRSRGKLGIEERAVASSLEEE
jgi:hypothetical protein